MTKKVFVGVSGGIDSAATVLLLKERGFDITGVNINMYGMSCDNDSLSSVLDIPIVCLDVTDIFDKIIIEWFIDSYIKGETPSPCVKCNVDIKWMAIEKFASQLHKTDNYHISTGHYCNIVQHNGFHYVAAGVDSSKDQSYYLWKLSQDTLSKAITPLGALTKASIRDMMSLKGHHSFVKQKESMGICFLKGKNYKEIIKSKNNKSTEALSNGEIVDIEGNLIGHHDGYPFYTIAQRKGLSIDKGLCVVDILPQENKIVVGERDSLFKSRFILREWSAVCCDELLYSTNISVKVRGIGINPTGYVKVSQYDNNRLLVETSQPAWALTKGQPAVFYIENRVIGGGIVDFF